MKVYWDENDRTVKYGGGARDFLQDNAEAEHAKIVKANLDAVRAAEVKKSDSIDAILEERNSTHGDWRTQAAVQQHILDALQSGPAWAIMTSGQKCAVNAIAIKLARVVSGNPSTDDHWDDIAGYAKLGKRG